MMFKTKVQLALEMIERVRKTEPSGGDILLADSAASATAPDFRNAVRKLGFDFAVGVVLPHARRRAASTASTAASNA